MTLTQTFWRADFDGTRRGLFRRTEMNGTPVAFAYLGADGWVDDPTLYQWWLDPGDRDIVEVDRAEAEGVASASGVELDATAA